MKGLMEEMHDMIQQAPFFSHFPWLSLFPCSPLLDWNRTAKAAPPLDTELISAFVWPMRLWICGRVTGVKIGAGAERKGDRFLPGTGRQGYGLPVEGL